MLELLAYAALALTLLPAVLIAVNLIVFRPPPEAAAVAPPSVSLLIPARNEEANIGAAIDAALASEGVDLEVVVLDDGSTDRTAAIVAAAARADHRLHLLAAPPLPTGWCGKQHACHVLAQRARQPLMVFVDADVRLAPAALARIAALIERRDVDLVSGFPQQQTGTLFEALIVPLIYVLLLGYLPIWLARRVAHPALAAGCGQLIAVRREAYRRVGGHGAIRSSRHDGITLPRAFRRAGATTDVFDATPLARCRMYRGAREVWQGFGKNATEGMATPVALPIWTLLLGGAHVLPFLLLPVALAAAAGPAAAASAAAIACVFAARAMLTMRFRQSWLGALLHPLGVAILLVLQWSALAAALRGRPTVWRDRAYASGGTS